MRKIKSSRILRETPQVVAAVHSPGALRRAAEIRPGEVDFLEIRVDNFASDTASVLKVLPQLKIPLLVTVRHPAEGGANALTTTQRRDLYSQFIPWASLIDVELRSWDKLPATIELARRCNVQIVASAHHFHSMPSAPVLERTIRRATSLGADVCKIAALAGTPAALGRLLAVMEKPRSLPVALMGMGRFGKISRLVLAQAGSVLNYGYLDQPNASGQWEATLLKQRLGELGL